LTADANFLVLDEPTNHLDMASVNILIQALQQYEGSFIVVSHDRYFLDNIANKIWFIENKEIKEYPGSYQEYEEWNSKRVIKPEIKQEKKPKEEPKKEKAAPTEDVKRIIQKKNKELSILEEKIEEQEVLVKRLETELAQEDIYSDAVKLQEYTRNYNSEKAKLETLQQDWESLAEEIMNLEG
jgi:ATP-binding cassette subfamily F protein 3